MTDEALDVRLTAEERAQEAVPASRVSRFVGRLVDSALLVLAGWSALKLGDGGDDKLLNLGLLVGTALLVQAWLLASRGQSVGKIMMGLRIVRRSGASPGFWRGFVLRELVVACIAVIPFFGAVFSFIDAVLILGSDQRCLHDLMADTRVIDVTPDA